GGGSRATEGGVRNGGTGTPGAGDGGPRGRRGPVRLALADARARDGDGLRAGRARAARFRADDRRARPSPPVPRGQEAHLLTRGAGWRLCAIPATCGITPSTTRRGSRATRRPSRYDGSRRT